METRNSASPLDLSVNAVLDITPRKIGKLGLKLGRAVWDKLSSREVRQLRMELEAFKTQQA